MIIESKDISNLLDSHPSIEKGVYHKKELFQEILNIFSPEEISYYLPISLEDLLLDQKEIMEKYLPMIKEDWIQI